MADFLLQAGNFPAFPHYDYSHAIWHSKHRGSPQEHSIIDSWARLSKSLAKGDAQREAMYFENLYAFRFLLGGRIQSSIGTNRKRATAMNCYVGKNIPDNMEGICQSFTDSMLTLRSGGGLGTAWHELRPRGSEVKGVEGESSGPLSFMEMWDVMGAVVHAAGQRRGAQLASMRIDHPDVEEYIRAKERNPRIDSLLDLLRSLPHLSDEQKLYFAGSADGRIQGVVENAKRFTRFNISIAITDNFMEAVRKDEDFDLVFGGKIFKTVKARQLWEMILRHTYEENDPGLLFIDRINELNNLWYCENIYATNPCGEQPLPEDSVCLLGSQNLTSYVKRPFQSSWEFDEAAFVHSVGVSTRMLDAVIEQSYYPLERQRQEQLNKRRVGQGIAGLADAFVMMRMRYGDVASQAFLNRMMFLMVDAAYNTSVDMAMESGPFPLFDADKYCQSKFLKVAYRHHPEEYERLISRIHTHGIRNSHLLSVAPLGNNSVSANNLSSSLEPIFFKEYPRTVVVGEGLREIMTVKDYAWRRYQELSVSEELTEAERQDIVSAGEYFVDVDTLSVDDHFNILEIVSRYSDSAVSKTMNVPNDISYEKFCELYHRSYESGTIKGCTTYRAGTGRAVLVKPIEYPIEILPEKLQGETFMRRANGTRWYIHVNFLQGKPIQIFAHTNHRDTSTVSNKVLRTLNDLLLERGVPEEVCNSHADKSQTKAEQTTRWLSLGLRYGIPVEALCFAIESTKPTVDTLAYQLAYCLRGYISQATSTLMEGASASACPECGANTLIYQEGCKSCLTCGHSAC